MQALAGAVWWVSVFLSPAVRTATLGDLDPLAVAIADVPLFVGMSAIAASGCRWAAVIATAWTATVALGLAVYATVSASAGIGVVVMIAASGASVIALFLVVSGRVPTEFALAGPFRFRTADPKASTRRHLATTAVQVIVFWSLFLGVAPFIIRTLEQRWQLTVIAPEPVRAFGAALFVAASAVGIWSAVAISAFGRGTPLPSDAATRLVIAGPYRFVRNPMALGSIAQGVAVGLFLSSWLVVTYALCGALVWNYAVRPHEERDLEERFGESFRRYRDEVRCWLPRLRPVTAASTV